MGALKMPRKSSSVSISSIEPGPADEALAKFVSCRSCFFANGSPVGVAYSGGADSTALLLAAARLWPGRLLALHVHHGLQAAADTFWQHCETQCAQWHIPYYGIRINATPCAGESPEDAARRHRYKALASLGVQHGLQCILLAQHGDDQVETLLLALTRGAGLPGLAAMPATFKRHGISFMRPLLGVGGAELRNWLRTQGIDWVEDPMNHNRHYTRSRIRLDVLPALSAAFPQYRETFTRSAAHAAQAQSLLWELAQMDLELIGIPPRIKPLQQLPPSRQANVLRYWLKEQYSTAASTKQLQELQRQIAACKTRGHQIHLKVGHGMVVRDGEQLGFFEASS